jgi:hypothetical protein
MFLDGFKSLQVFSSIKKLNIWVKEKITITDPQAREKSESGESGNEDYHILYPLFSY